jgi:hypothetical protein
MLATEKKLMTQSAPYPVALDDMVKHLKCKPGWSFELSHRDRDDKTCSGLTFIIYVEGPDSYDAGRTITVSHWFPVPAALHNYLPGNASICAGSPVSVQAVRGQRTGTIPRLYISAMRTQTLWHTNFA